MKLKKALSAVLALVLMVSGMSFTAFADGGTELIASNTTWEDGENLIVSDDLTINVTVTVTGNVTLTIAEGKTLTIKAQDGQPGINVSSGTLTVDGAGTLNVTGGNSGNSNGCNGITISSSAALLVTDGMLIAKGGDGGSNGSEFGGQPGGNGISGGTMSIDGGYVYAEFGDAGPSYTGWGDFRSLNNVQMAMTAGKLRVKSYSGQEPTFAGGSNFSGGRTNFLVPAAYVASGYECVEDGSVTDYTHKVQVKPDCVITNNKPEADKAANHGYISVAAVAEADTEVTVTATPNEGYAFSAWDVYKTGESTTKVTVTDGKFTMPAYAVTVNATFSEIQTEKLAGDNFDLDLETDTTDIPESTTVDQYYIKTTGSETVTNNRIKISWDSTVATIRVSEDQKWNPSTLSWEDYNYGDATVKENTNVTVFTLKNYSINSFTCTMSFTPLTGYTDYFGTTAASFSANNNTAIAAVVTGEDGNALPTYYVDDNPANAVDENELPTLTITGTLDINASKFDNAAATEGNVQYGNYTITCTKAN